MSLFSQEEIDFNEENSRKKFFRIACIHISVAGWLSFTAHFFLSCHQDITFYWISLGVVPLLGILGLKLTKHPRRYIDYVSTIFACILVPLGLYVAGGIVTTATIFTILSLFVVSMINRGRRRVVNQLFILGAWLLVAFIERRYPDLLVFTPPTLKESFFDWLLLSPIVFSITARLSSLLIDSLSDQSEEILSQNIGLKEKVIRDEMTGLFNKQCFYDIFPEMCKTEDSGRNHTISLVMVDIDHFKFYNDSYGHLQGDDALIQVAKLFSHFLSRPGDYSFRFGGEEFLFLLNHTDEKGALKLAGIIQKELKHLKILHKSSPVSPLLTLSMGVATFNKDKDLPDLSELLEKADKALYAAKDSGRNRACVFRSDLQENLNISSDKTLGSI